MNTKSVHSLVHDPSNGKACRLSKVDSLLTGFDPSDERIAQMRWTVSNTHVCKQQMRLQFVHRHVAENIHDKL